MDRATRAFSRGTNIPTWLIWPRLVHIEHKLYIHTFVSILLLPRQRLEELCWAHYDYDYHRNCECCHSWDCHSFSLVTVGIVTVGIRVIVTTIVELRIQVLNCHRSLGMYRQNVLSLSQVEAGRVERGGALVVLQATSHTCICLPC